MLRRIRSEYVWGKKKTPSDSYDYFRNRADFLIHESMSSSTILVETIATRINQAKEVYKMLECEQYIEYYFTHYNSFTGEVFYSMYQDFRSGAYITKDYNKIYALKRKLPHAISSSPGAFNDFVKFVNAGWFDIETGKYILSDGRQLQHIGRAAYWICNRNRIASPEKVFAPLWGVEVSKIKDWKREKKFTKEIDTMIKSILE